MRIKLITLLAMPCFAATANVTSPSAPYTKLPDHRVVSGHAAFGFDLLRQLSVTPGKNVFISPSSIAAALEMTYNGASGQTKAQMAKTLHLDGLSLDLVDHADQALRTSIIKGNPKVKVAIANSLWAQHGYPFLPEFIERNKRYFGAEIQNVEFGPPETTKRINAWVESRTNGKIRNLLPKLPSLTRLVLVNAVYFNGKWTEQFKRGATKPQAFTLQDGVTRSVPIMWHNGYYAYLKGDGFQAIRLPYGTGRFAMYVVLPDAKDGLPELLKSINVAEWRTWIRGMHTEEISIGLPRFRAEYTQPLNGVLMALGMSTAFDRDTADFRGMTAKRGLYIGLVQHKAFVDVNEEGTEAAAATAVVDVASMPASMVVDHPFLCAIRDDRTGEILFLGAIYNPSQR